MTRFFKYRTRKRLPDTTCRVNVADISYKVGMVLIILCASYAYPMLFRILRS